MTEVLFVVPLWTDLTAVAIGAVQGAMFAARFRDRQLDWLGVAIIGVVVGLGGGLIRDILLSQVPASLQSDWYLPVASGAALLGMFLLSVITKLGPVIIALDALTIGMFGAIGSTKALAIGLPIIPSIFVGVVSAVGGSVLRDVMLGVPVALMHVGSLYAVAAGAGTVALVVLWSLGVPITVAAIVCVALTTLIRLLAVRFGWTLPEQRQIGRWRTWRRTPR
ncbi:trimeric intracellular cation channel family protein [Plantibacter sp. Mn2098]|uniref:trimeric intracellular cation channel family protein n=1 Tax=Plantibacter sp. Mn2098 TaxID=3395266 RepID=UPI003BCD0798